LATAKLQKLVTCYSIGALYHNSFGYKVGWLVFVTFSTKRLYQPNETKLALVQVAFYAIWPGNGLGLFYNNRVRDPHGPY